MVNTLSQYRGVTFGHYLCSKLCFMKFLFLRQLVVGRVWLVNTCARYKLYKVFVLMSISRVACGQYLITIECFINSVF